MRRWILASPLWTAALTLACHAGPDASGTTPTAGGWGMQPQWPAQLRGPHGVELSAAVRTQHAWLVGGTAHGSLSVADRTLFETAGGFVVGLDDAGAPRWVRVLESESDVRIQSLAALPDGGALVVGRFAGDLRSGAFELHAAGRNDCLVARLDPQGAIAWIRGFGGPGEDSCNAVAVRTDDVAWLVGDLTAPWEEGITRASEGASDVFVASVSLGAGTLGAARVFGSAGDDHGRGIALTESGGMMVVGSFGGRTSDTATGDAPMMSLGEGVELTAVGDADGFAVRLDSAGVSRFAWSLSTPGFDLARSVLAVDNGWVITGAVQPSKPDDGTSGLASSAPLEGVAVTLDDEGRERWRWSDPSVGVGVSAAQSRGGVYVLASSTGPLRGEPGAAPVRGLSRVVVVSLDAQGSPTLAASCDGPGPDLPASLATDGRAIMLAYNGDGPSGCLEDAMRGGIVLQVAELAD